LLLICANAESPFPVLPPPLWGRVGAIPSR
jgi:hypothetical protein